MTVLIYTPTYSLQVFPFFQSLTIPCEQLLSEMWLYMWFWFVLSMIVGIMQFPMYLLSIVCLLLGNTCLDLFPFLNRLFAVEFVDFQMYSGHADRFLYSLIQCYLSIFAFIFCDFVLFNKTTTKSCPFECLGAFLLIVLM